MGVEMELEFSQLVPRYEKLRRRNAEKERRLLASLSEYGQQLPIVVVDSEAGSGDSYVLLDGYKRVRALKHLHQDTVRAVLWELAEADALLLERLMRTTSSDSALEQGWLLEELNERFALSHEELARRFGRSQSWVSRRLALVRAVPCEAQEMVRDGKLPAHAAMKYLVPMARAKRTECVRLVTALGSMLPSSRDIHALYAAWTSGNDETRELVVTQPALALRAHKQAHDDQETEKTPVRKFIDDFGILIGISRRARANVAMGLIADLLPPERAEAQRFAQDARIECDALFSAAADLLDAVSQEPTKSSAKLGSTDDR